MGSLLMTGANPNQVTADGSLLHTALKKRFFSVAHVLIEYGANITTEDENGVCPADMVTTNAQLVYLLCAIKTQPPKQKPSYKRNHCANCKAGVFIKRKSNPLANMFTKHKQIKYGNCSCCSRLFCRDCLQQSKVATGSLRHSTSITSRGSITKSVFGSRGSMVSQKSMKKYSKKPSFGGG